MKKLFLFIFFVFGLFTTLKFYSQIYRHNFGVDAFTGKPYTVTPTILNSNLSSSSWTTSFTEFTTYAGSTGNPNKALGIVNSSGTPTITLTFNTNLGSQLSITSFSFWRQRSAQGAQNWSMTINGISVGSGTVPTTGSSTGAINVVNPINNLTGTVTIVMSLSSAGGTGTFRFDDFTLNGTVTAPPPPSNDNCSSSTLLPCGTSSLAGTTVNTVSETAPLGYSSPYGVWYSFVGDGQSTTITSLAGSGFDHEMVIMSGTTCGSTYTYVTNQDIGLSGDSETFTFTTTNGTQYYIYIAHWSTTGSSTNTGTFTISRTCTTPPTPPINDNPSGAITLTVNDGLGYKTFTNVGSTNTTTESTPTCASYVSEDVWFKVVVPNGVTILDFDTQTGGITDGGMSIYRGTIGSLTQIECDDDDGLDGAMSWVYREDFTPGETIYIRFWEYGAGTTGTFKILVSSPTPLPVELIQFDGIPYPQWNVIKWSTASEQNSSHFDLEMSTDGENWRKITTRFAAGNSTEEIKYSYIDYNLNSLVYYRLQQFDNDGQFKTYGPIVITKTITNKKIIKYINLMGQEVNPKVVSGIIIEIYDDGTMRKTIR